MLQRLSLGLLFIAGILFWWGTPCVMAQPAGGTLRSVLMDYNTSGTHAAVAGIAAQVIRVYQMTLFCNGANNVTLQDSTPATLHPVMDFSASQGMVLDYKSSPPWFMAAAGKDFIVNLSANQQCGGVLWYTQGAG
jgi:hypothetical protein